MQTDALTAKSMPSLATGQTACTRRGLLKLAGATAVSLTVGHGLRVARAADPVGKGKTEAPLSGGRELGFYVAPRDPKLAEKLAWLREQGVRHIGLDGMGGPPKAEDLDRIGRIIAQAGMQAVALHGVGAMAHPENDQQPLRTAHLNDLERAVAWKCQHLVIHFRLLAIPWRDGVGFEEASIITKMGLEVYDGRVTELLAWLCEEATKRGVRIAVENLPIQHQFSYRVEEIVAMIKRLKLPNLGICLDSGHVHCSGLDVATAIRTAGSHLMTTHLHDNLGGGDPRLPIPKTDLHLAVRLGTIHWPATIRALDESGYRGPAVIEGARIGPKETAQQDWQRGISMCMANWRALEALAKE